MTFSIIKKSKLESANRIDAEYFQPEYLELERKLISTKLSRAWSDINGKFITGPFGSEFNVENYVTDGRYRYIRGKDVKDFFLLEDDNVYIPKDDFERLKKYSLQAGDLLISVVGTLGNTVIIDRSVLPAMFSCKSTAFRTNDINTFYFIAYLNSKYGHGLLSRSVRGAVQTGLNIDDLRSLLVYIPTEEKQNEVANLIKESRIQYSEAEKLYSESENLLLEELGLNDFKENDKESTGYTVKLSDAKEANRLDAEFFQPKYEMLIKVIDNIGEKLEKLITSIGHSTQPEYYDRGVIAVLAQKHFSKHLSIDIDKFDNYTVEEEIKVNDKKYILKKNDVLISSAGEPGLTCVWDGEYKQKVIPGSFVTVVRTKDNLDPNYLGVFLNSIIGKMQFEKLSMASVQKYVYPNHMKDIVVPKLSIPIQQKIADLVRLSHEARKKAKELLEEAKWKVEEMIEKGGKYHGRRSGKFKQELERKKYQHRHVE